MYITMCLDIPITIMLWVLSVYPFIKYSMLTIQFSHMSYAL